MPFIRFIILCVLPVACVVADSQTSASSSFGPNPDLSDGARALQLKQFDEGIRLTLRGLKLEVSSRMRANALSNLCAGYLALRRFPLALESCNDALQINPRSWRAYNNRALVFLGQGRVEAARRDVETGLTINPASRTLQRARDMAQSAPVQSI